MKIINFFISRIVGIFALIMITLFSLFLVVIFGLKSYKKFLSMLDFSKKEETNFLEKIEFVEPDEEL